MNERADAAALAHEVALAMFRLRARFRLESADIVKEWSYTQLSTMFRLLTLGPMPVSELAKLEHVRKQSMAEAVSRMRERGVVTTEADPSDGRKTLVRATPEARQLIKRITTVRDAWLTDAIAEMTTPDEQSNLMQSMKVISRLSEVDAQRDV